MTPFGSLCAVTMPLPSAEPSGGGIGGGDGSEELKKFMLFVSGDPETEAAGCA